MRRILTAVLASSLLALTMSAVASAHDGSRHEAGHHARHHHRRHHHRAHTVVFAPKVAPSGTTTATGTPTQPGEPVATVASFEGGVLKITLPDGSTVSGKVTDMTEVECGCDGHHFEGGPQGFGHDNGDDNDFGDFHHDDEQGPQGESSCGVSSLIPGAKVKEAELSVSGAGAVWEKVELLPQS